MELREYRQILIRRWWIPVALTVLVTLLSAWQLRLWQTPPPTYIASVRMLLGVEPLAEADVASYDPRYYAWLTSEYLVDDFTEVLRSELFAGAVNHRLAAQEIEIPAGLIRASATTGRQHRIIHLSLNWSDAAQLQAIADATVAELTENAATYFAQLGTERATVSLLDGPAVATVGPDLRRRLEFPLRVILALMAGIGLLFVVEYLDTSVRQPRDLEEVGLSVIGIIPKK
jgi:capsular polysaccharide biosynthesis protein